MRNSDIADPLFREAVEAIDSGNISVLQQLLEANPSLVTKRLNTPTEEGYFKDPYLIWFVADNPIRHYKLPGNIIEVTKLIIRAMQKNRDDSYQFQLDCTLGLVATGRIPRECGVQIDLIDLLIDEGAIPGDGLGALAHGNIDAARHLIKSGGKLTLATAVGLKMMKDIKRLLPVASEAEKLSALTVASFYGNPEMIFLLLSSDVNPNAYPAVDGFHTHATPLHQAVYSGSLEAVKLLVEAGANINAPDKIYNGTPLGWAIYMQNEEALTGDEKKKFAEVEDYLKTKE